MEPVVETEFMVMLLLGIVKDIIRKEEDKFYKEQERQRRDQLMIPTIRVVVKEQVEIGVKNVSGMVEEQDKLPQVGFDGRFPGEGEELSLMGLFNHA